MNTEFQHSQYNNFSESEKETFKKWLQGLLETSLVHLTFTKKDGTIREMKCTLMDNYIPNVQKDFGEDAPVKSRSKDTVSFWDIESEGWRSCRYDSITQIKFTLGE
jgi:hypothetical protein